MSGSSSTAISSGLDETARSAFKSPTSSTPISTDAMPPPLSSETFSWLTLIVHGGMSTVVTGWPSTTRDLLSEPADPTGGFVEASCFGTVITIGSKRDLTLGSAGLEDEGLSAIRALSPINSRKEVGVGPGDITTFATEESAGVAFEAGVAVGSGLGSAFG